MATEGSWIPEGVTATIKDLATLYGQVEATKLAAQLAKAQASAAAWDSASTNKNLQANQNTAPVEKSVSPWLIGAGVLGAVVLVYLAVK